MSAPSPDHPEIIAHRGYSARAPENTLAAIDAAADAGADAVEFDVHVAACGTPVLFHDVHLGRTTNGVGPVRRRTLEQLRALDAGGWFSPDFAGERIPSLAEALERSAGRFQRIYCEVKGYRELDDLDRTVGIARKADLGDGELVFISMDWTILDRIAGRDPDVGIGWIVDERPRFEEALERATGDPRGLLDFDHRILLEEPGLVGRCLERGVPVAVWTVDHPAAANRLRAAGVSRFTTNDVERLLAWRDGVAVR